MSTSPYSFDLRMKVIEFLEAGNSQRKAAEIFNISKTTVTSWYTRYKKEGSVAARKRLGAKPRVDSTKFIEYVNNTPNIIIDDIAKEFSVSKSGAYYWLKKLEFTYKKKTLPTLKRALKEERNT
jgi:transposase